MGKFSIFKSTANSQYYFRLKADNNEIILSSEGYHYKFSCEAGIQSVKNNAKLDSKYEKSDKLLNYTFNLKGANGEIIGRSESYTTSRGRDAGIEDVKRLAPTATIQDLT